MRYLLIVFVCCASLVSAMELETLLEKARAYHDGKLAKIDDMVLQYTGTFMGPAGENAGMQSTMTRKGEKWRMDATMNVGGGQAIVNGEQVEGATGLETVVLFDGTDIWTTVMGMKMKTPKDKAMEQMSFSEYWNEPPAGSTVVGEETVNGRECYVVEYPKTEQMSAPVKVWIDQQYFVNVQSETVINGKTLKTVFSDFKAAAGDYVIPHQAVVYSNTEKTVEMTVTKVEVNKGVSDELFDPATLGGSDMNMDLEKLMKQAEEMQKKFGK